MTNTDLVTNSLTSPARNQSLGAPRLTAARTDQEAVATWLAKYTDNKNTFSSFRREAERFLMWATWRRKDLPALMVEDILAYKAFLVDPQPVSKWCIQTEPKTLPDGSVNALWRQLRRVPKLLGDGLPNPAWRPFMSALGPAAAKQTMTILFGMFEHLSAIGYLHANPLRAASRRAKKLKPVEQDRYFDQDAWSAIIAWIERMPKEEPRDASHYWRTRFLFNFLYLTGLRRFELAKARSSDLRFQRGKWWLDVVGKGDLDDCVPLQSAAMDAIKEYRESTGRPALPSLGDNDPLIMDFNGTGKSLSDRTIYAIVKEVCRRVATDVAIEHPTLADKIKHGSTHWLRHTAATHQLEAGIDPLIVQKNLRHSSFSTTQGYLHQDRDRQHQETERHG